MCGLVGLIHGTNNGFNEKDVVAFEEMLYVDALRGEDATGVALVTNNHGAVVMKEAAHSAWFTWSSDYNEQRKAFTSKGKALLGHNRKATIGGKKDENAHPFTYEDRYVFFHNGTLQNHKKLLDTEVDSEALGFFLTKCQGDVTAIGEFLDKVNGAYACVWYDADKHTVYMLRNNERPLNLITFENGSMAYASESWMAIGPASRNYLKCKEVTPLLPHTLYSIDLKELKPSVKSEPIPKKASPSVTFTKAVTGGIKPTVLLGKRQVRAIINEVKSNYIGFFVDDAQCCIVDPNPAECYDFVMSGMHDEYPGTVFKFIKKAAFPYEAEEMVGKYMSAVYQNHSFTKGGILEVWVDKVSWKPSKPLQPAVH